MGVVPDRQNSQTLTFFIGHFPHCLSVMKPPELMFQLYCKWINQELWRETLCSGACLLCGGSHFWHHLC